MAAFRAWGDRRPEEASRASCQASAGTLPAVAFPVSSLGLRKASGLQTSEQWGTGTSQSKVKRT